MIERTVPTSTVNITGFFHRMSGRSITNARRSAAFSSSGANSPARRLSRRASFSSFGVMCGGWIVTVLIGGWLVLVFRLRSEDRMAAKKHKKHKRRQEAEAEEF